MVGQATHALSRTKEDQIKQLKSLVEALRAEDYAKAQQILRSQDLRRLPEKLPALQDCFVKLALEIDDTEGLKQLLDPKSESSLSRNDRLYVLYRLEKYSDVLEAIGTDHEAVPSHLRAQTLFHLQQPTAALEIYRELLSATDNGRDGDRDDLRVQLQTNLLAAAASNAVPYCRSEQESAFDLATPEGETDLLVNHGILRTMMSNDLKPLRSAVKATASSQTADVPTDKDTERARLALQCASDFWKGSARRRHEGSGASSLPAALASVRQHNQALAVVDTPLKALQALPPHHGKWTLTQSRIAWYNKACLQLRAKQYGDCRSTVKEALEAECFATTVTTASKKQQKQQKEAPRQQDAAQMTVEETLWWQSRFYVLLYYCDKAESASSSLPTSAENVQPNDQDTAEPKSHSLLQSTMEKLQTRAASPIRDHSILYLLVHLGERLTTDNVPVSLQALTGMRCTLQPPEEPVSGDWHMAHGDYVSAITSYEQELQDDPSSTPIQAKLVRALSFVDPDRAMAIWDGLKAKVTTNSSEDLDAVNGAELEQQELPRLKSARKNTAPPLFTAMTSASAEPSGDGHQRRKKSHDAVLRRRARQRQAHLDKLAAQGLYRPDRPVPPDPERWLPKYERSYNRKRRNKQQQHRGAQGGVSEQDTQKLDVVARQQAKASGDASGGGKSTAHLAVSGAGVPRKAGRKK